MPALPRRLDHSEWATLMFTDIEGSTLLVQNHSEVFFEVVDRHFEILREKTVSNGGKVVVVHSDAFFASFDNADDAFLAAVEVQRALSEEDWPDDVVLKVRIGLHTGEVYPVSDTSIGYVGIDVHRAARISEAASGGQILMSSSTMAELDKDKIAEKGSVRFLGSHRLKDLSFPEHLYEVQIAGLSVEFPPIKSIDNHPTNLPKATNSFVGRQSDISAITSLLTSDQRLVTLAGPGGAGKTRLAIETAYRLVPVYGDGVFMVSLGAVAKPSLFLPVVAQTLGVPEYRGRTVLEGLTHFMTKRHLLLLIDNFEHLIEAAADLKKLLGNCPKLDVLVTTREPLRFAEEVVYPVAPMQLPDATAHEAVSQSDAVQLFAERARAVKRDFVLDERTVPLVANICRRLDGLPLAIELAASRLRILTLTELSGRLDQSLSIIGKAHYDDDQRYTTLSEAISWSYRLLNPDEQRCFARMSVFRGGFSLAAAEHLCGDQTRPDLPVVDILISLCDKSLLTTNTAGGSSRFSILETIRQFALAKLQESGELDSCKDAHAIYYLQFVEQVSPGLVGPDQRRLVGELQMEMDNIRAALGWSLERADFDHICRYLQAVLWYLIPRAQFTEGLMWTDRALAIASGIKGTREFAILNDVAGWFKLISGDYAGAVPNFEVAHEIFKSLGCAEDVARTMITLGATMAATIESDTGPNMVIAALDECKKLEDWHSAGIALIALGEGARGGGDMQSAAECYEEALTLMRRSGDQYWMGALLLNMCHVCISNGDVGAARQYLREAIQLATEFDYTMMINLYVALAGEIALKESSFDDAARLFGAATTMLHRVGVTFEFADQVEFDKAIELTTAHLGAERYGELHAEGMSWDKTRALAFAHGISHQE